MAAGCHPPLVLSCREPPLPFPNLSGVPGLLSISSSTSVPAHHRCSACCTATSHAREKMVSALPGSSPLLLPVSPVSPAPRCCLRRTAVRAYAASSPSLPTSNSHSAVSPSRPPPIAPCPLPRLVQNAIPVCARLLSRSIAAPPPQRAFLLVSALFAVPTARFLCPLFCDDTGDADCFPPCGVHRVDGTGGPSWLVRRYRVPQALHSMGFVGGPLRHCGDSARSPDNRILLRGKVPPAESAWEGLACATVRHAAATSTRVKPFPVFHTRAPPPQKPTRVGRTALLTATGWCPHRWRRSGRTGRRAWAPAR